MLMILQGSWLFIWYIISQYWRIITSQKQYKTVSIILCRNIGKTCAVYGTISCVKKIKCASPFIQCYQLDSCSGDPTALKKHWFVELWGARGPDLAHGITESAA